ncbi:MAG: hypothetical protein P5678_10645 [Limnospira sp. PMC 1240.20]|uniref:hypothetical protein n=1 Tax=unclassified Limnospira TaxID=2642885 RepID=UPI0028E16646|nr:MULTISPECIES: hypothetical protein [unclassified Limnospira]MDT9193302.1 hypothetical protein [Limnospira sp. PMC 1245.20]MDT9198525.1 hypothetical protein [Limnospira sp. PMC 1042.18]MDT9203141.1 hypothetical protein [Limnospira sp. PMC 1243.20]MDT9213616.1 hypothetical protein [Limnospira sp. PMC 1256.20]MDT9219017.1 hypothetical protein [Limnospira sp. PMC 1240.20]
MRSHLNLTHYKTQSEDTSIDAELMQFGRSCQLSASQKLAFLKRIIQRGIKLVCWGIHQQSPNGDNLTFKQLYVRRRWGELFATYSDNNLFDEREPLMIEDPIAIAYKIIDKLNLLNIPYYIGGSVASSLQGEARFTQDIDLVIYLELSQVEVFIETFSSDFYVSDVAVKDAILGVSSYLNLINFESLEKADIFISRSDDFSRSQMNRRQLYVPEENPEQAFYLCTPEDTILQKLVWMRIAQNESQKQWRDILGVLKIQRERLDLDYLWQWSEYLNISASLNQAIQQSGIM